MPLSRLPLRPDTLLIEEHELREGAEQIIPYIFILFFFEGAGAVGEDTTRGQHTIGVCRNLPLTFRAHTDILHGPLCDRRLILPEHAFPRARCIDEHPREILREVICDFSCILVQDGCIPQTHALDV